MTFRQSRQHGLLGRLAPVLTLFAVGCSLIVPLDEYVGTGTQTGGTSSGGGSSGNGGSDTVGGTEGVLGGTGGGTGGSIEVGGTGNGATGGTEMSVGGTGETGGSDGGTTNGGAPEDGGVGGEPQGGDGPVTTLGGSAGSGTGETGGLGGLGGSAGGGRGGMAGTNAAGCGGKPDFMNDPMNCGSCGHVCDPDEQECLAGYCASSPCDGVCAMYTTVTLKAGDGYRQDGIGTGEVCTEIYGYAPRSGTPSLVCWNFANGRTLQVNGKGIQCDFTGHPFDVPLRRDGLCVRVTAGNQSTAGFELPD